MSDPASATLVIDPIAGGIGDTIVYCWVLWNARRRGVPLHIVPRHNPHVYLRFGIPVSWLLPPGQPNAMSVEPPKGTDKLSWVGSWLKSYADVDVNDGLGLEAPPFMPEEKAHNEALRLLDGRGTRCSGKPLVLVFPEVSQPAWICRNWPVPHFVRTSYLLQEHGYDVCAVFSHESKTAELYPTSIWGFSKDVMLSMVWAADCVLTNESGPMHVAGSVGTTCVVISGPTSFDRYGAHLLDTHFVTNPRVSCTNCNFEFEKGYRRWCDHGCFSMAGIDPWTVFEEVKHRMTSAAPRIWHAPDSRKPRHDLDLSDRRDVRGQEDDAIGRDSAQVV